MPTAPPSQNTAPLSAQRVENASTLIPRTESADLESSLDLAQRTAREILHDIEPPSSPSGPRLLHIESTIDPAQGPIVHEGDGHVSAGVPDGAVLAVSGNLVVEGMIEGATITAGGDLEARGGITGRDRARLSVGGTLRAKYLDSVVAEVMHRLAFEREAINCNAVVHGSVESPGGSIIGGSITVTRRLNIMTLGSPSAVKTLVQLESVPLLEPILLQLQSYTDQLQSKRDDFAKELERLGKPGRPLKPAEKERQTELSFELHGMDQLLIRCMTIRENAEQNRKKTRTLDVRVRSSVFPGVIFVLSEHELLIKESIEGPFFLKRLTPKEYGYSVDGGASFRPVKHIAEIRPRTTRLANI